MVYHHVSYLLSSKNPINQLIINYLQGSVKYVASMTETVGLIADQGDYHISSGSIFSTYLRHC